MLNPHVLIVFNINLLALIDYVQAEQSNSTVNWTDNPSTRETLNIVLSCAFTIFACTWSVLHLNIPDPTTSKLQRLLKQVKWMVLTMLCPELIFSRAIQDYMEDRRDHSDLKKVFQSASLPERQNVGEWVMCEERSWKEQLSTYCGFNKNLTDEGNDPKLWTLLHTKYLNMGGLRVKVSDPKHANPTKRFYDIRARDYPLFDSDYSPLKLFSMSENEILDKSKGDAFTKFITVTQILWLVASIITRKANKLPSSQLEIVTLAFSILAVATYLALWNKPKNIHVPTIVQLDKLSRDDAKAKRIEAKLQMHQIRGHSIFDPETETYEDAGFIILMISTAVFGSLHCLAWNFTFPSMAERMIWRVSSISLVSAPIVFIIIYSPIFLFFDLPGFEEWMKILSYGLLSVYCLARLMIIGIAFSSLRSMPPEVYITTWSKYIPDVQ